VDYDVEPFREAFERSGLSLGEVAARMDWWVPDHSRVKRALGLRPDRGVYQQRMTHDVADRLRKALNADPTDVGM